MGSQGFGDGLDRSVCVAGLQRYPGEWPVNHRSGLAIAPLREVARRDRELLLCDQLHDGDCEWADGIMVSNGSTSFDPSEQTTPVEADLPTSPTPQVEPERPTDADG